LAHVDIGYHLVPGQFPPKKWHFGADTIVRIIVATHSAHIVNAYILLTADSILGRTETHRLDSHVKIQKSLARPQLHVAVSSPDSKAPQTALADDRLLGETASGAHSFSGCRLHLFYPGRCGGLGSRAPPSYHLPPSVQPHLPEQNFWLIVI
jgi:hypothetical protein